MRQQLRMAVIDDQGTIRSLGAKLFWKRFDDGLIRARIDLTDPPHYAGTIILLAERAAAGDDDDQPDPDVVVYKPSERRDRLVTVRAASGPMFGTDFTYEDFTYLYSANGGIDVERLADEQSDGRTLMVLESRPKDIDDAYDRGAVYTRVVSRIDIERCLPVMTRFFGEGDDLRKELSVVPQAVREFNGRWIPYEMVMRDPTSGSKTIYSIDKIEFEPEISDLLFSRSSLKRGR